MTDNSELDWEDEYSAPRRRAIVPYLARYGGIGFGVVLLAAALYYLVGMVLVQTIDDDPTFTAQQTAPGESRSVSLAAALIERETVSHPWVANDPFFLPGALLDNMPNYQQGIVYALSRFAVEMTDQIGRTRGSSEVDTDLDKAAGLLKYPGDVWIFDLSTSLVPTASSEAQYKSARRALLRYNERLAAGQAAFDTRADNLQGTLLRITADLGSASAVIDRHLTDPNPPIMDMKVDDIFYSVKGRLYAYSLLLRELGVDFEKVIADRDVATAWARMLDSLRAAAALDPLIVVNGAPDGLYWPSHLAVQGFYLLRARTQLREIISILQK